MRSMKPGKCRVTVLVGCFQVGASVEQCGQRFSGIALQRGLQGRAPGWVACVGRHAGVEKK